jgi:hypothetical protein
MRIWKIGALSLTLLLAVSTAAAAQTRPHVSGSESSRSSGPTCVVNGDANACGEASMGSGMPLMPMPGPVIVAAQPALGPMLIGSTDGRAATDTDVNRSSRNGNAVAR